MSRFRAFERIFRPFALVCAVGGIGTALYAERSGIGTYPWRLSWPAFLAAVLLFACSPFAAAAVFHILLRGLTGRAHIGQTMPVWMRAFIARYVPSGTLTMAIRLRARARLQATSGEIWRASLLEQLVAAIGGSAAATAGFLLAGAKVPIAAPGMLIVSLLLGAAVPARRTVAHASVVSTCSWLVPGTAAWLIVAAMTPQKPNPLYVAGAYSFAWMLGFVIVLAPSGLGIREATFVALLSPQVGVAAATVVAVTLRLANTMGDVLAFSAVEAVTFASSRRVAHVPRTRRQPTQSFAEQ
jgi:glycosyltransferase 2 family protein